MAVFYKTADNIARRIEIADPNINPSNSRFATNQSENKLSSLPVVFGTNLITPVPIARKKGPTVNNPRESNTEVVFYALSASNAWGTYTKNATFDGIGNVYINNSLVTNLQAISYLTGDGININWRVGRTASHGPALASAVQGSNFGGSNRYQPNNFYCSYFKAGEDITDSAFWSAFSVDSPFPAQRILNTTDLPDNSAIDIFAVFYAYDPLYFTDESPLLQLSYTRRPVIPDGAGGFTREPPTSGNCILEMISNTSWGMGLDATKYARADFVGYGSTMGGVFDIIKTSLTNNIKIIDNEITNNKLYEQQGVLRYASTNATGIAITGDNIIGDIAIEYPDAKTAPTQLIATYESYERGSADIIVGTDTTNVRRVNIRTASDLASAETVAQNLFEQLTDTVTISFKADKSFQQFSLYDTLTLSTDYYSATIKIISMTLNADYTYSVVAEASLGSTIPGANLGTARPVIPVGRNYYRPKAQERPLAPSDDPADDPTPVVPADPPAPAPTLRTIAGLNHPYNFITGAENTNWYLGSTEDGINSDGLYDSNGCRTRFRLGGGGAVYKTDFSLIFRPTNIEPPRGIIVAYDVHAQSNEAALEIVGKNRFARTTRYQFPGFFNNEDNKILSRSSRDTDWKTQNITWWNWQVIFIMSGGSLDEYAPNDNPNNFVYQYGNIAGYHANNRYFHTIDANQVYYPSNLSATCGFRFQRRSGAYRVHFSALYGDVRTPEKIEYIGSTSTYGDATSVLPADVAEARQVADSFGLSWTATYTNPPSRSIS